MLEILEEEVRKEGKKKGGKKSGRMKGGGGRGRSRRMKETTKKARSGLWRVGGEYVRNNSRPPKLAGARKETRR